MCLMESSHWKAVVDLHGSCGFRDFALNRTIQARGWLRPKAQPEISLVLSYSLWYFCYVWARRLKVLVPDKLLQLFDQGPPNREGPGDISGFHPWIYDYLSVDEHWTGKGKNETSIDIPSPSESIHAKLLDQFLPVVAGRNLLEHQNRSLSMRGRNKERKRKEEMWSINLGALSQFILTFLLAGKSKAR